MMVDSRWYSGHRHEKSQLPFRSQLWRRSWRPRRRPSLRPARPIPRSGPGMTDASAFERAMDARIAHAQDAARRSCSPSRARARSTTRCGRTTTCCSSWTRCRRRRSSFRACIPTKRMRQTAEKVSQKAAAFGTEMSLNRGVFDALVRARRRQRRRRDAVLPDAHAARFPARRRRQGRGDTQDGSRSCATSSSSSGRSSIATSEPISGR